jgi:hypothetical protein
MSSEQFQAAHSNIYNLGTHLLQYLQEIRQSRLSEGDDTKGLQSVENDITTALTALSEKGKIYFILNKVDQKTERDREIEEVIQDLKRELSNFGFPNPIIYPASSRQGLLAKLIQQEKATKGQIKDFKKFFSARYATENEDGDQ